MTKFTTKPIYENRLWAYDDIQTVWPDKLCLSIMIWWSLLISLLSFNFLEKPFVEDALANSIEEIELQAIEDDIIEYIEEADEYFEQKAIENDAKLARREILTNKPLDIKQEKKKVLKTNEFSIENLYNFVRKWEGAFQAEAFCDSYYKTDTKLIRHPPHLCEKWTIWFWTNSYPWEVITYDEAIKRKQEAISWRNDKITSDCLSENQRIAIVDFTYQYSSKYVNQMRYYANNCQIWNAYQYIVAHRDFYKGKKQWWLVKREQMRINIFYN